MKETKSLRYIKRFLLANPDWKGTKSDLQKQCQKFNGVTINWKIFNESFLKIKNDLIEISEDVYSLKTDETTKQLMNKKETDKTDIGEDYKPTFPKLCIDIYDEMNSKECDMMKMLEKAKKFVDNGGLDSMDEKTKDIIKEQKNNPKIKKRIKSISEK